LDAKSVERGIFYESLLDAILEKGAEQGWRLTVCQDTSSPDKKNHSVVAALWSWDHMLEQQLYD